MHLIDWKARRAGRGITVVGTDGDTRRPAKIVGVDVIEPAATGAPYVTATDHHGVTHTLRTN